MTSALLWGAATCVAVTGLVVLIGNGVRTRAVVRSAVSYDQPRLLNRVRLSLDRSLQRTRLGVALRVAADELGLTRVRAVDLLAVVLVAVVLTWVAVGQLLSWLLAPVAAAMVVPVAELVVRRERLQRREKFIAQMPQLARVLSNAAAAGLSLRTSVEIAAEELSEPAGSEMGRVAQSLAFGDSLEDALTELEKRLPSREVVVLVSTLIVSARAGGSLISALRRIAETLEERKQTRREILTTLAEARSTALLIPVIGVGSLLMIRSFDPDAIDTMLSRPVGQIIFALTAVLYTVGGVVFQRVTKVRA